MALGSDIGGIGDIDPFLSLVDGRLATAQRVATSLQHSRGVLWWAPDRGFNLYDSINGFANTEALLQGIQAEAEADPGVDAADVSIDVFGEEAIVSIALSLNDGSESDLEVRIDQLGAVLDARIIG